MKKFVNYVFFSAFFIFVSAIFIVVVRKPQNNLIPAKMVLYMLIWVGLAWIIRMILGLFEKMLEQKGVDVKGFSVRLFIILAVVFGIALYLVSLSLRAEPITDYESVYDTALTLAKGEIVEDWRYFAMWTNNLGALSILTFLMKLGIMTGFADPYYFVLAVNVLQVVLVMWGIYYLAGEIRKNNPAFQWTAMALFMLWTPIWGYSGAFYSDQLSLGGSIVGMALFCLGCKQAKWKKWLCIVLAGVLWSLGAFAKVTAWIPLVALVLVFLFGYGFKKWIKEYVVFGLALLSLSLGLSALQRQYPSNALEEQYNIPSEYWVAMGLLGNGTYAHNSQFVDTCVYMDNRQDRLNYCREIISENWMNLFDRERMEAKTLVIFGSGEIAPTSLIFLKEESFLWDWFYWEGEYFWKYCCISTGYFFAVILLMILGSLFQLLRREESSITYQCYLAVFGLFAFLLLWEAQNKQLYNHIPWMTLAAVYGLERLHECIIMVMGKIRERRQSPHDRT